MESTLSLVFRVIYFVLMSFFVKTNTKIVYMQLKQKFNHNAQQRHTDWRHDTRPFVLAGSTSSSKRTSRCWTGRSRTRSYSAPDEA